MATDNRNTTNSRSVPLVGTIGQAHAKSCPPLFFFFKGGAPGRDLHDSLRCAPFPAPACREKEAYGQTFAFGFAAREPLGYRQFTAGGLIFARFDAVWQTAATHHKIAQKSKAEGTSYSGACRCTHSELIVKIQRYSQFSQLSPANSRRATIKALDFNRNTCSTFIGGASAA